MMEAGLYTIPQASWLVGARQNAVRVWVEGRLGDQRPIIENQIGRIGRKVAISFTNLMELRFVNFFADAGVNLRDIRSIMGEAKKTLHHPHPFATKTIFKTDGKKIIAEIAKKNGVCDIYDLKSKNYEMTEIVMSSLKNDVIFDPNGDAVSWKPRPEIAPNVVLNPSFSFGKPILLKSRIPTEVLAKAYKVEGSVKIVSDLYDVPERQVREAVGFERDLRHAA